MICLIATFTHYYDQENLAFNILIVASAEEENAGEKSLRYLIPDLPRIDIAIVGEPTLMDLAIAEKGLVVFDLRLKGSASHAAHQNKDNPLMKLPKLIKSIDDLEDDSFLVSIPRKSSLPAVKKEIEKLLSEKLVGESAKFVFSDRITPYATLHYEYNSLVLALNQNTRNQIMNVCNEKYKNVRDFQKKKPNSDEYETNDVIYRFESAVSRTLRFGKERMYRLCDGVFP